MAYRKKTLRSMSPVTRKLARLRGEISSIDRRLKKMIEEVQLLEVDSQALWNQKKRDEVENSQLEEMDQQVLSKVTKDLF